MQPGLQLGSGPSHDDHHHDDQEVQDQEAPWSGHLEVNSCFDGICTVYHSCLLFGDHCITVHYRTLYVYTIVVVVLGANYCYKYRIFKCELLSNQDSYRPNFKTERETITLALIC